MKFGSVCSGIEAASVAWKPLGWQPEWFAEIEPFPSAVLAHHWPHVTNHGDMTTLVGKVANDNIPAPDILAGGTPCQAFSVAGQRGSLSDERGNLTLTFCELADAIDTARAARGEQPAIIVWENVPGVLSTSDNAFGCFLGRLAGDSDPLEPGPRPEPGRSSAHWTWKKDAGEHCAKWPDAGVAAGPRRTVAWRVLDAQYFGLAQRRRRVFVVASARAGFDPGAVLFEFDGVRRDSPPRREEGPTATAGALRSTDGGCDDNQAKAGHVQPCWLDGGQVSQTLDAVLHKGQTMPEKNRFPAVLTPVLSVHGTQDPDVRINHAHTLGRNNGGENAVLSVSLRGREGGGTAELGDDKAGCLRASSGGGDKPHVLAPIAFSCKDHGADAGEISPTLRAMGHGASHANAGGQVAICITGDVTHTLKADGFDGSEDGTGRGQPIVAAIHENQRAEITMNDTAGTIKCAGGKPGQGYPAALVNMRVRRLTPLECERLQGFPDGHTEIPVEKRKQLEADELAYIRQRFPDMPEEDARLLAADGPRYKAIGNSWAVTCARWIGWRIDRQLKNAANDNDEGI